MFLRLTSIGGDGITDCGIKGGVPVGRGLFADLAVVMTDYGCASVSCAFGFLLKRFNDDYTGLGCLIRSL